MTYAIEDLLEHIAGFFNQGLPFVAFKSPNEAQVHLLWQETDALHHLTSKAAFGFVMATYSHEKAPYLLKPDGYMSAAFKPILTATSQKKAPLEVHEKVFTNASEHSDT